MVYESEASLQPECLQKRAFVSSQQLLRGCLNFIVSKKRENMTTQRAQQLGIIATQQRERTYMKTNFHLTCGGFLAKSLVNSLTVLRYSAHTNAREKMHPTVKSCLCFCPYRKRKFQKLDVQIGRILSKSVTRSPRLRQPGCTPPRVFVQSHFFSYF